VSTNTNSLTFLLIFTKQDCFTVSYEPRGNFKASSLSLVLKMKFFVRRPLSLKSFLKKMWIRKSISSVNKNRVSSAFTDMQLLFLGALLIYVSGVSSLSDLPERARGGSAWKGEGYPASVTMSFPEGNLTTLTLTTPLFVPLLPSMYLFIQIATAWKCKKAHARR